MYVQLYSKLQPALYKGCGCSPLILLVFFFIHISGHEGAFVVLICISLLANDDKHHPAFGGHFCIFLVTCWFMGFVCLVNESLVFVLLICGNSSYIFSQKCFFQLYVFSIFFPVCSLPISFS